MAEKRLNRHSVSRVLSPIALSLFLVACGSTPDQPTETSVNQQVAENQDSAYYLLQADRSSGSEQVDWLLIAFDVAINEGDLDLADRIMRRLAQSEMSPQQQALWQLSRADLLLAKDQPTDAIRQLNFLPNWVLEDSTWAKYHQTRSEIYFALFDPLSGFEELVSGFSYLTQEQRQTFSDSIWSRLNTYSADELAAFDTQNQDLQGWINLASIAQQYPNDFANQKRRYELFLNENFDHPAAFYTPNAIKEVLAMDIVTASNTALLLPLSGKYAKQASVIRDGFLFALFNDKERDETLRFSVIDTDGKSIEQLEQELATNNSDFIVGPLQKNTIEELQVSQQASITPIPMLALNFPDEILEDQSLCYITLSPEQEAAEAAQHLFDLGYRFPLFVAPNNSYGKRMQAAFDAQWQTISNTASDDVYFKNQRELQYIINTAFDIRNSDARIAQLSALFDTTLEGEARSRRDIDAVYIVAKDSDLNLIKPFIDVAINPEAQAPAVFASSYSNSGGNNATLDLTGVTYSDIPFLADPDPKVKEQYEFIWEKSSHAQKRLFALGMDAYSLTHALPNMKLEPEFEYKGQTGVLSIDESCVVDRQLSWAEFGAEDKQSQTDEVADELPVTTVDNE
ncbi:penicillin-binding protein activator [Vibrio ulleungensis]|uniref:Penicillin-binding protein activator n=1 Tax=Vibrio ulleungensis TaxID=2807619 RepID=A0ABS2HNL8_9VIBR|nr:penicillin-binding protein activator [Vibrio ulleungensis]MBM7037471.1 penicillin-binding protein activator [Vibrio ulleungensis]